MNELSQDSLVSVFGFNPNRVVFPYSWCGHLPFAAWLLKQVQPKVLVELGTHTGNSYFTFCQAVSEYGLDTRCYAVDTWQGDDHAGKYGDEVFADVFGYNDAHYARFSNLMRMKFDDALSYFPDNCVDLLHIDGLHTYEAVKADFDGWLPKLTSKAIVVFHDINVRERNFGVWQLWEELKLRFPSCEFHHSHGLGVLLVGAELSEEIKDSVQACNASFVRNLFALKAEAIVAQAKADVVAKQNAENQQRSLQELQQLQGQRQQLEQDLLQHLSNGERSLQAANQRLNDMEAQRAEVKLQLSEALTKNDQTQVSVERCVHLEHELHALRVHCGNLSDNANAVRKSWSWRITAPIRWVSTPLVGLNRSQKTLKKAIELGGGVAPTAALALKVLREEGLDGVKWRVSNATALLGEQAGARTPAHPSKHASQIYAEWLLQNDPQTPEALKKLSDAVAELPLQPLISVVMPVYNPPLEYLRLAVDSLQKQTYPNWELCIADDASPKDEVRAYLKELSSADTRVKVVFREKNGHISAATNSALALATGEFIALMDNDDMLTPHALAHVVKCINSTPDAEIIYSDEDKIDESGERYGPYFKCDFNYELFLAQNMICHLGVYRHSTLKEIGGFREGLEGAQDWDLALRVIEATDASKVVHIPRVLYHWRAFAGSTALSMDQKSYAVVAQVNSVQQHLDRLGKRSEVAPAEGAPGMLRVRYEFIESEHKLSIIIPTRDRADLLKMCIDSIEKKSTHRNYEILVVDNGSSEPATLSYFESIKSERIRIIPADIPFNYPALNNIAAREATGDLICLMNNDIEILSPDWIQEMGSFAIQPEVGCVGAKLWYPDGTLQHGGVILGIGGIAGHAFKSFRKNDVGYVCRAIVHQSYSAVTAACLMIRKSVFDEVGGLDESFVVALNDVDFCLRVRAAGYRNVWTPYAEMNHHESATRGYEDNPEKIARFDRERKLLISRWEALMMNDPAYSPNLTLDAEDFGVATNSRVAVA